MSHELPTSTELFDERKAVRVDSNGDYDLKDLFCKSGRRYEMGLGLNSISSDIFNLKPVGDSLKFIIVSYHRKIKKCFQFTNAELNKAQAKGSMVTNMEIGKYDEHFAEVFIEQIRTVTNSEVMFEEFAIQTFFNPDDLWDPRILNEEALETSPLGTVSNYRNKYMVSPF